MQYFILFVLSVLSNSACLKELIFSPVDEDQSFSFVLCLRKQYLLGQLPLLQQFRAFALVVVDFAV